MGGINNIVNSSSLPWQYRMENIFNGLTPQQIETRTQYWKEDEAGIHNTENNSGVRMRSYITDGQSSRQELSVYCGQTAGQIFVGNDSAGVPSTSITYADVIVHSGANAINFQTSQNSLLWNSTPFNPGMNAFFNMPPFVNEADLAFGLASGLTGAAQLDSFAGSLGLSGIGAVEDILPLLKVFGVDGGIQATDLTTPFGIYSVLSGQKVPMLNFAAIAFLQLFFTGRLGLLYIVTPAGLVPNPLAAPLFLLMNEKFFPPLDGLNPMHWETPYQDDVQGTVLGEDIQQLLLSTVPGMSLAAG